MSTFDVLLLCLVLISGTKAYFNDKASTEDGETINLKEAVNQFFNSPIWRELEYGAKQLYREVKTKGWYKLYGDFVKAVLDPMGESDAYRVLGLSENASHQEIRRRYKELAIKWHPDRNRKNKHIAQKKFMEIQKAYEILSNFKSRRAGQNSERTEL